MLLNRISALISNICVTALLEDIINTRLKQALQIYYAENNIPSSLSEREWNVCRELEGVLNIIIYYFTILQNENKSNATYGPVSRLKYHNQLSNSMLMIIDI